MNEMLLAARWYLAVQAFGFAAWPLSRRVFRFLPDGGYGLSKALGLLVGGWLFWSTVTFGWLPNTVGSVLVVLLALLLVGLALSARGPLMGVQPAARTVWITEIVFAVAFIAWCLVRARMPRIQTAGGEKWMEIAFLRAILRAETFPPHDPWLSGFAISYYYFGYVIMAMLTRLSAVPSSIAFNLGVASWFALACVGGYTVAFNLLAARHGEDDGVRWGALLGPLLLAVTGNLMGLLEMLHARGVGPAPFWRWLDIRGLDTAPPPLSQGQWVPDQFFWWWRASRTVRDYTPWGTHQEVIDEFPAFSFVLGDLHPHVLALPFVLLSLGLALNAFLRLRRDGDGGGRSMFDGRFPIYALCLGGLGFLNTWDFPIYLFIFVAAFVLARWPRHPEGWIPLLWRAGLLFIALIGAGILLYLPFWLSFRSQAGGILINLFNATRLPQFLVMFGPLTFLGLAFTLAEARRWDVRPGAVGRWTLGALLGIALTVLVVMGVVVGLVWAGVVPPRGPAAYLSAWLQGQPLPGFEDVPDAGAQIRQSLLRRLINPWVSTLLVAWLVTLTWTLIRRWRAGDRQTVPGSVDRFVLLLLGTGVLLTLSVEHVYLRDNFGTRMNTVFKFYFQAWVVWSMVGAYALVRFLRRGGGSRMVVGGGATLLILAGLLYPALAIPARAGEYGGRPTLDGGAYLSQVYPADYAAIAWLNRQVRGAPVILEAPGSSFASYVYEGRVSAHTGLPTVLGWGGHEHQWRGSYEEQARREPDIERLYGGLDGEETLTLLDRYDISYVYVGPVERERYSAAGLRKFEQFMDVVYDSGEVTIYRR